MILSSEPEVLRLLAERRYALTIQSQEAVRKELQKATVASAAAAAEWRGMVLAVQMAEMAEHTQNPEALGRERPLVNLEKP